MAGPRSTAARQGPTTGPADGHVPALPRAYVPRERLWTRLDDAIEGAVTVLIGPGGAGKTLGIAGWLRERRLASGAAWVSGDGGWDLARLTELLDRRDSAGRPGLVVVDDAHRLPLATLRAIDQRLDEDPTSLRLLLAARWDLPLARLAPELLGHLTTLRGDLLRLDDAESAAVVAAHAHTGSATVAEAIASRSQGWCAAVVLAARTVGAAPDPVAAAKKYATGHSATDRVASEVFATLRPRERHLLLCVATEPEVTPTLAAHLTRDSGAGQVLADLELTGLLVTRVTTPDDSDDFEAEARYAIHPLLTEIVRRRIASGGVDVMRAVATVERAVRVDVARGDTEDALRRLIALGDHAAAAEILATEGPALLLRGHGVLPHELTVSDRSALEDDPETWFALALDRWFVGDAARALHWLDKLVSAPEGPCPTARVEAACARLMRARLGIEPLDAAIVEAEATYAAHPASGHAGVPILLWELGSAHAWSGDLDRAAELHHTGARLAHALGLPRLEAPVLSSLALVEYARGRVLACTETVAEAAALLVAHQLDLPFTESRLALARGLAAANDAPAEPASWLVAPVDRLHDADLFTAFWARLLRARIALGMGSQLTAERILEEPLPAPLPRHLMLAGAVERALMATLSRDSGTLLALADTLTAADCPSDAALVTALRADLSGDPRRATSLLEEAARDGQCLQPSTRALGAVLLAQLRDATGDLRAAHEALAEALALTEVRRDLVPFLDWSWHGTRLLPLLERHLLTEPSEWGEEMLAVVRAVPSVVTTYGKRPAETATAPATPAPVLSPRERDVLMELARGSTYADIAASLFVSENTVKTHVSSLYAKLSVNRRSAALAAARSMRLL